MTGGGSVRDFLHRAELRAGVVLGDDDQGRGQGQADQGRAPHRKRRVALDVAHDAVSNEVKRDRGQHAGNDDTFV